jgi:DNA-directed RNA polymerase alpha subunit
MDPNPLTSNKDTVNDIDIDDMDLSKTLIKYLKEKGYQTLSDIKEAGMEQLRNIDKLTDIQLKQISKNLDKYNS